MRKSAICLMALFVVGAFATHGTPCLAWDGIVEVTETGVSAGLCKKCKPGGHCVNATQSGVLNCQCDIACGIAIGFSKPMVFDADLELRGRVIDVAGLPVAYHKVSFRIATTGQVVSAKTGPDGRWFVSIGTASEKRKETLDLGDVVYDPGGGTTEVTGVIFKCPVQDVCW